MGMLIKSELFQIWKEKKYLIVGFIVLSAVVCQQMMSICSGRELTHNYLALLLSSGIMLILYIGNLFFICFHIGRQFSTKRIHLEVMNGLTRKKIFFSKLFFILAICLMLSWIVIGACVFVLGQAGSHHQGIMMQKDILVKAGLLSFILLRFYAFMIFVNFLLRQGVISGMAVWLYHVMQMFPSLLGEDDAANMHVLQKFGELFGWEQCLAVATSSLSGGMTGKILVYGVVEMLVVGIGSYVVFSRQELK